MGALSRKRPGRDVERRIVSKEYYSLWYKDDQNNHSIKALVLVLLLMYMGGIVSHVDVVIKILMCL